MWEGFPIGFGSLQTRQLFEKLGPVAMINLKVVLCNTKVSKIGTLARRNEKCTLICGLLSSIGKKDTFVGVDLVPLSLLTQKELNLIHRQDI